MSTLSPAEPGGKLVRSSLDSLFLALALRLAAIDVLIAVVLGALCMLVYGSEAPTTAVGLFTAALLARMALWLASLRTGLQALAPWYAQGIGIDDEGLRSAEQALDALPRRIDLSFVLGLALSLGVVVILVWTRYPDALIIGAGDALALVLQAAAIVCSTPLSIRALTRVQLDDTRANLVAELLSRGMSPTTTKSKLAARFNAIAVLLVAVPLTWLSSLAWLSDVRNTRAVAVAEERRVVELAARDL
ncbi:MAG: hypothetical protein KC457_13410, partial [Myxococcales bacterium]|nr:hypothetical protein [Myxococcales bacterium]